MARSISSWHWQFLPEGTCEPNTIRGGQLLVRGKIQHPLQHTKCLRRAFAPLSNLDAAGTRAQLHQHAAAVHLALQLVRADFSLYCNLVRAADASGASPCAKVKRCIRRKTHAHVA